MNTLYMLTDIMRGKCEASQVRRVKFTSIVGGGTIQTDLLFFFFLSFFFYFLPPDGCLVNSLALVNLVYRSYFGLAGTLRSTQRVSV